MAGVETIDRLRHYLGALSPEARRLLIGELERAVLRGEEGGGAELVLGQLREIMRVHAEGAPRVGHAARLFFRPVEPFMVDDRGDHNHPGRVARSSLESLWTWVRRDLLREETKVLVDEVSDALLAGNEAKAEQRVHAFQDRVAKAMAGALESASTDERLERRLLAQIGTPRAAQEASTLCCVLEGRDALATLSVQLPAHIDNLANGRLDECRTLIEETAANDSSLFVYSLLIVMSRLAAPWQLISFAVKAAASDAAARVAETRYAVAVNIVLAELERQVRELRDGLRSGRGVAVGMLLKSIHDGVRGLRTEMDLPPDNAWARTLASLRSQIGELLGFEIDNIPGRVRRLLRVRKAEEIRPNSVLDLYEVAETETLLEFVSACRLFASELAISEITRRTLSGLEDYLERGTRALADSLRHAGDADRRFRQSQLDAALRFCAKVLEPDHVAELGRVVEMAASPEHSAARA